MFENPRRGRQARSFTTNVPKILDLKSSFEQIFFRKLSLGAPRVTRCKSSLEVLRLPRMSSSLEKFKKGIFRDVYILRVPHPRHTPLLSQSKSAFCDMYRGPNIAVTTIWLLASW